MSSTHFRTCNLCEAMCGLAITVEGGRVKDIRGDEDDPLSRGHICPKAVALKDIHEDPDRLKRPMVRRGSEWNEIGWDEAFDLAGDRLGAIRKQHGRHAIAFYQGNPTVHNHGTIFYAQFFAKTLGTRNKFSATSLDQLPHMLASLKMFGHQALLPVPDVDRTRFFLMFGANPIISNGSLMTAPGIARRLKSIRERGGEIVVVDPRRTETAEIATEHVFVQPGTDALLLAAMIHTILKERGPRLGRLASFTDGVDRLKTAVARFTPEAVASSTRIDAEKIHSLALRFYDAEPAVAYGRVGLCTQEFGGLGGWLVNALNVITGNLDREGGFMFTKPAIDTVAAASLLGLKGSYDRRRTRVRNLPEFGGELPVAALADEILTPGKDQIRALVTSCGNPVLSAPNGRKLDRALASLDFMVSIDIYLNETSRHASLILPPTFALEHDHYDVAFHMLAVRNTAKYSLPIFPKPVDAKDDWEIFTGLIERLKQPRNLIDRVTSPLQKAFMRRGPRAILELGLRLGPHKLTLKQLEKAPHGIDLGALEPCLPKRLGTKDKRIDLAPALYLPDLDRLFARLGRETNHGSLSLIGRRELRTNNSWMHNTERMVKGKERCTLRMHPEDARSRGIEDGKRVKLESSAGELEVWLEVTDEMMPGVVCLPHGWGHDRAGIRMSVAQAHPGASINDVTDDALVDDLSGTIRFSDVRVTVRPV